MTSEEQSQYLEERRDTRRLFAWVQAAVLIILGFIACIIFAAMLNRQEDVLTIRKMQADTAKQVEQIREGQTAITKVMEVLRGENRWSMEDRAELHDAVGAMREAIKRVEVAKRKGAP